MEAVRRGLALEPGDHEFQTLGREIEAGAPLETMEYHWIDVYKRQVVCRRFCAACRFDARLLEELQN